MTGSVRQTGRGESVFREAFLLPMSFLTVALLGGFRVGPGGSGFRFLPPPLVSLVLAMLLMGVMARGEALVVRRLMSPERPALANLNGAVILATLFVASAQVFNSVTPEAGLLHLIFNTFFVLLLWNTLAAHPDTPRLLRSLMVVLGSAFGLKYIVLGALYDPQGGLAKRVLTTLLEGVTLGAIEYRPDAPLTGYVGFFTVLLYLTGLFLLARTGRVVRPDIIDEPRTPLPDAGTAVTRRTRAHE